MLAFLEEIWNKWVVAVEKSPKGQKKRMAFVVKAADVIQFFSFFYLGT